LDISPNSNACHQLAIWKGITLEHVFQSAPPNFRASRIHPDSTSKQTWATPATVDGLDILGALTHDVLSLKWRNHYCNSAYHLPPFIIVGCSMHSSLLILY
jgi:hypothetical protein